MDDRRRDGGTNSTLRTKEQGKHLTLNEHDDDNDDDFSLFKYINLFMTFSVINNVNHMGSDRVRAFNIHPFSILSDDRSKASSKTMPPHSEI